MSNPTLTIAYLTARRDPQFEWFAASLYRESRGNCSDLRIIAIDFHADGHKQGDSWTESHAEERKRAWAYLMAERGIAFEHRSPMGNVWQGKHRLTKENWFCKSAYLNAAVALCETDYLACVDDLSVLMPGWLAAAREATRFPGITCGAYRKVRAIEVIDGEVKNFREFQPGIDSRWKRGSDRGPVACDAGMMYGCSFVIPIEAALKVNGWPHYSDGMGYEDCVTGTVMGKHGYQFRYDRQLLTYESDEHHFIGKQMRRDDPGRSPEDKSHVLKRMGEELMSFPQNWPDGETLRSIRAKVLADPARTLPVLTEPTKEPFTGRLLAELGEQVPPQPIKFQPPVTHNLPKVTMSAEVQSEIVKAHALLQGWCPMDKALLLCSEIDGLKPDLIVEIGVFGGKSLIPMLIQLRANGKGRALAIEPWDNEAACEGYAGENFAYWHTMDFAKIRKGFETQLTRLGLESFVNIQAVKSDAVTHGGPIDLLHIDGQKDATVIRDVNRFASKVRVGGVCCLNDLNWEGGHVAAAAARLLDLGFVENYRLGTGAVYRRTHIPS